MPVQLGSAYGKIDIDTGGAVRGIKTAQESIKTFQASLNTGQATLKGFGQELLSAGQSAGIGSRDMLKMAGSTGIWTDKQILAARASRDVAMKARELSEAVANGTISTREAGRQFGEFARQNQVLQDEIGGSSQRFQIFGLTLNDISAGFNIVSQAAQRFKQIYDFAKEGAAIEYTETKFRNLARTFGTTGEILEDQLLTAMDGLTTRADSVRLATDIMGLGLVQTSDQAVRLARVSAQLGMDLNQLTLTLANKTTMRFDQLGVSVEGFDERLQELKRSGLDVNQAFTEAFLQQAEAQIEKVGGISEQSAGGIMQFEAAIGDLGDTARELTLQEMIDDIRGLTTVLRDPALEQFLRFITQLNSIVSVSDRYLAGYRAGIELFTEEVEESNFHISENAWQLNQVAEAADKATPAVDGLSQAEIDAAIAAVDLALGIDRTTLAWKSTIRAAESFDKAMLTAAGGIESTVKAADDAEPKIESFLDGLDRQIASPLTNFIKDLQWLAQTGGRFEEAFAAVQGALDRHEITPQQAEQFTGEILAAVLDVQTEIGELDFEDAAQNLSDALGIPIDDAKERISSTEGLTGAMDAFTTTEWKIESLGVDIERNKNAIYGDPDSIYSAMQTVTQKDWRTDIFVGLKGPGAALINGGGSTTVAPGTGGEEEGYAAGGLYMAGRPMLVGEKGPEILWPTTAGRVFSNLESRGMLEGAGAGGNVYQTIHEHNYYQDFAYEIYNNDAGAAALTMAEIDVARGRRLDASMGM